MAKTCLVCTREVLGNQCTYCHCYHINALDDAAKENEKKRTSNYLADTLAKITDFSVKIYDYRWDSNLAALQMKESHVTLANGNDCYQRIVWSQASFGQYMGDEQKRSITISYNVAGVSKTLSVPLEAVHSSDYWKLGIQINADLSVSFYLGGPDKYSVSGPYDLELK